MDRKSRIREVYNYLRSKGIIHTQKDLAELVGANRVTVSNALNDRGGYLTKDFVERINRFAGNIFNIDYIFSGEGRLLQDESQTTSKIRLMEHNFTISVPLVNQYVQVSYIRYFNDENYMETLPRIPFMAGCEAEGNYVAFEVRGDSMNDGTEDSYLEGDRLLCREIAPHLWAAAKLHIRKWDFVIVHKEGIIVKRIIDHDVEHHTITIHSLNNLYPDQVLDLAEVYQIFNVIELQRPRRR